MIQITSDFSIDSQINILYPVTIESSNADAPFTLTKDTSYFGYLFRVQSGGSLTLRNVILDGDKANHPEENQTNRSLVYVTGGTLNLQEGAVLQNNYAYLEGGGVYFYASTAGDRLAITESVSIAHNTAFQSGGGIWNHGESTTTLIDGSIADNEAVLGNDIYSDSGLYMEGLRELKNGVCIANAASVVKLGNALTGTSEIQLDSGGNQVTSIPQGSTGNITIYARWEKIAETHTCPVIPSLLSAPI